VDTRNLRSPVEEAYPAITPHGAYGAKRPVVGTQTHTHQGIDLASTPAGPVVAVASGLIVPAEAGIGGIVRVLALDDGRCIVYCDLGSACCSPGQYLEAGEVLGYVNARGFVHVAVRSSRWGEHLDPTYLIPNATWRDHGHDS